MKWSWFGDGGDECDVDVAVISGVVGVDDSDGPAVFFVSFLWGDHGDLDGLWLHIGAKVGAAVWGDGPLPPGGCLADLPGEL